MKIDFHVHMVASYEWYSPRMWEGFIRLSIIGSGRSFDDEMSRLEDLYDPEGRKLIRSLEEAGIDKAVIFPSSDYDLLEEAGCAGISIEERNLKCYQLATENPDKFIPFLNIDPRRKNALQLFVDGLDQYGVRGLKLLPGSGFYPHDKTVYPLYEIASERGVPVLFHSGPLVSPMKSKFADPLCIDEVAADFPDMTIVMAHSAFGYWPISLSMAQNKPNIYLELSGWQTYCVRDPYYFHRSVRTIVNIITSRRVLFGTDSPFLTRVLSHKEYIEAISNPPEAILETGLGLSPSELEDILGGNACRLLRLDE
jgi:predicted TIM-barrel fold metal-dependent hydrolase